MAHHTLTVILWHNTVFIKTNRALYGIVSIYTIKAPTWAEALVKAAPIIQSDKPPDDDIRIEDSEFLDDTIMALPEER